MGGSEQLFLILSSGTPPTSLHALLYEVTPEWRRARERERERERARESERERERARKRFGEKCAGELVKRVRFFCHNEHLVSFTVNNRDPSTTLHNPSLHPSPFPLHPFPPSSGAVVLCCSALLCSVLFCSVPFGLKGTTIVAPALAPHLLGDILPDAKGCCFLAFLNKQLRARADSSYPSSSLQTQFPNANSFILSLRLHLRLSRS
ncbi:hypothetical protein BJ875DRAFT_185115 [Amylocarpus encephaloides]|uniref:Uncharacterized protein n=1 Tax=Amylocarpus encephaloides TaxID=45428 RepID=A0A9P7YNT3_9HELO|nr:hypothetical protein BJ875DRAFT_185115 [Amylocarpus encephaloides]